MIDVETVVPAGPLASFLDEHVPDGKGEPVRTWEPGVAADEAFVPDLEAVIRRARVTGLLSALMILSAGDEAETSRGRRVRELWPSVRVSAGIHPHHAGEHAADPAAGERTVPREFDLARLVAGDLPPGRYQVRAFWRNVGADSGGGSSWGHD